MLSIGSPEVKLSEKTKSRKRKKRLTWATSERAVRLFNYFALI